ncbi:hypothetical protein [Inquilinus sp. OTU3971]|uniref:hypothetical protein n=1 Tax=Inquilinus sp. OTU3971 TaxID=3043855 RepID=UPI00313DD2AF
MLPETSPPGPASPVAMARRSRSSPSRRRRSDAYPLWFHLSAAIVFGALFLVPTLASLFFSLTRWTLFSYAFFNRQIVEGMTAGAVKG